VALQIDAMADIATAIISGSFAVVGSLGSVWLKDYLERQRQVQVSQPDVVERRVSAPVGAPAAAAVTGSRLRPLFIAIIGFAVGVITFLPSMFPSHADAGVMGSLGILLVVVLFSIIHYARLPNQALALFHLEMLSLWAAFAFGGSLLHRFVTWWNGPPLKEAVVGWVISCAAGLLLIPLVRRLSRRAAKHLAA